MGRLNPLLENARIGEEDWEVWMKVYEGVLEVLALRRRRLC